MDRQSSSQLRLRRETVAPTCSANCLVVSRLVSRQSCTDHKQITSCLKVAICSYFYAPEWTRTTTDREVHKALNLARLPIPPRAQGGEYSLGMTSASRPMALQPCIRPRPSLQCEHMFVAAHSQPERGGIQAWI
jgi:hypothetical protein